METRIEVLFCYAREDEVLARKLENHLQVLVRQKLISVWHDSRISPGTERVSEINQHLNTAQIFLLLVSADFMASDYCYGEELQRAIERHKRGEARVIPVILRPVLWAGAPFSGLQALPKDGEPATTWPDIDQAFLDVAKGVLKVIDELEKKSVQETDEKLVQGPSVPNESKYRGMYSEYWSRRHRGLLVLLIDQSGSMLEEIKIRERIYTNGQIVTATVNELIYSAISATPVDELTGKLKDYFDILVLGYGDQVVPLIHDGQGKPISIRELALQPKGQQMVMAERYDSKLGKVIQVRERRPYWITEAFYSNYTQMTWALKATHQAIKGWLEADKTRQQSFPPIVLNITDGAQNGEGNPRMEADHIRSLYTNDGHALLFNCHLTSHSEQYIAFPETEKFLTQIKGVNEFRWAKELFYMSSILPESMVSSARNIHNIGLKDGARGFLYNASPADLINFLNWGTRPAY